jgi:DNA repair protein SbcD/Mre11
MMKVIHTSDWHLGHRLYGQSRYEEQKAFLHWLLQQIESHSVDALIVAGDVFDTHNPSAESTKLYYQFLMRLHTEYPHVQTVIIGGNHDSAQRLDAPREVLSTLNVHVVGGLPNINGSNWDNLYCPLQDRSGKTKAWVAAVPFLKASDLPIKIDQSEDKVINGVREVYRLAINGLKDQISNDQALILTGHCEMRKGLLSKESERKLSGYSEQSMPNEIFTSEDGVTPAYVALGHLHLAQSISDAPWVRYSGAPLPFSISERRYPHQVVLIEFEGHRTQSIEPLLVPEELKVQMIKIPEKESSSELETQPIGFDEVIKELKKLPNLDGSVPEWKRPLLQVSVHSEHPDPNIKVKVIKTLKNKHPRLAKLSVTYPKKEASKTESPPTSYLCDIEPEEVFKARWKSRRGTEVPLDQLALFTQLKDLARTHLVAEPSPSSSSKGK